MTPSARKRQFTTMERDVMFARRGKRIAALRKLQAERLNDLRAVADRTREGWTPPEPVQADMFAGRSP